MSLSFPIIEGPKAFWYDTHLRQCAHEWQPRLIERYGPIVGIRQHGWLTVYCAGAEAARYLALNPDGSLSADPGAFTLYGRLFSNAMFFQEGDAHHIHRDAYKSHFKQDAMAHYVNRMQEVCARQIALWPTQTRTSCYPLLREISLRMGCAAFFDRPSNEITALVSAYQAFDQLLKSPLLAFRSRKLLAAKHNILQQLQDWIMVDRQSSTDLIDHLRQNESITTLHSKHPLAESLLSLLFAVHDTTSSSLATLVWQGSNHTELQERWRISARIMGKDSINVTALKNLHFIGASFNEALRWCSPTQGLVRRVITPCLINGYQLPAGAFVSLAMHYNHHDRNVWENPSAFQPERFLPPRDEHKKVPYQWLPFGGGPHKCIGLHMADTITRIFIAHLCRQYCFEYAGNHRQYPVRTAPTAYPKDWLPLRLLAL